MNFSSPIRVTWDTGTDPEGHRQAATAVAGHLAEARVFHVHIGGDSPLSRPDIRLLVERLRGGGIAVEIEGGLEEIFRNADWLRAAGASPLLCLNDQDEVEALLGRDLLNISSDTLLLCPDREAVNLLDRLVTALMKGSTVKRVLIPNPWLAGRMIRDMRKFVFGESFLADLKDRMNRIPATGNPVELIVHDFFLARALAIRPVDFSGCQAGNALAHIAPDGTVHPCATMTRPLGNLAEPGVTFKSIWAGTERKSVVSMIQTTADLCGTCPDLPICHGGCRGLAHAVHGSFDAPDPGCGR